MTEHSVNGPALREAARDALVVLAASTGFLLALLASAPVLYGTDAYLYLLGLMPDYPLFTAPLNALLELRPPVWAVRLGMVFLGGLACAGAYLFGRRMLRSRGTALGVAGLVLLYPPFAAFSIVPANEPLFLALLFLGFILFELGQEGKVHPAWAGVAMGLASLVRYEAWLALPLMLAAVLVRLHRLGELDLRRLAVALAAYAWGPVACTLYKSWRFPAMAEYQQEHVAGMLTRAGPIMDTMAREVALKVERLQAMGLTVPAILAGLFVLAGLGAGVWLMVRGRGRHRVYFPFLVLATAIQVLPVAADSSAGAGAALTPRQGLVPGVFALFYLGLLVEGVADRLGRAFGPRFRAVALRGMLLVPLLAFGAAVPVLLTHYQVKFAFCSVDPQHITRREQRPVSFLLDLSRFERTAATLRREGVRVYPASAVQGMGPDELAAFLREHRVTYLFTERGLLTRHPGFQAHREDLRLVARLPHFRIFSLSLE